MDSFVDPLEEMPTPCFFSPVRPILDFCKIINLWCFKPLSLWQLFTAGVGN